MKKRFAVCLALLGLLGLMAPLRAAQAKAARVVAAKFHADWCGGCRVLGPKLKELGGLFKNQPVKFVVLDQTSAKTTAQAAKQAKALNMAGVFKKYAGGTGFVVLVNAQTGQEVGRFDYKLPLAGMKAAIDKALKS